MISKKIIYYGNFDEAVAAKMYDLTRNNEITGEVKNVSPEQIQLKLEGDASFIKLIQHQIENTFKDKIKNKEVSHLPYQNYKGIVFLLN